MKRTPKKMTDGEIHKKLRNDIDKIPGVAKKPAAKKPVAKKKPAAKKMY